MATISTFADDVQAAIATVITTAGGTPKSTTPRPGWDFPLAAGETTVVTTAVHAGKSREDSNSQQDVILATLRAAHSLVNASLEESALEGVVAAVSRSLTDPAFYRGLASVLELPSEEGKPPEIDIDPEIERVGLALRFSARLPVILKP